MEQRALTDGCLSKELAVTALDPLLETFHEGEIEVRRRVAMREYCSRDPISLSE